MGWVLVNGPNFWGAQNGELQLRSFIKRASSGEYQVRAPKKYNPSELI